MGAVKSGSRSPVRKEDIVIIQARGGMVSETTEVRCVVIVSVHFLREEATGFADRLIKHGP